MNDTQKIDALKAIDNVITYRLVPGDAWLDSLVKARDAVAELIDLREQILAYFARDLSPVRLYDICRQHPAIKRVGGAA